MVAGKEYYSLETSYWLENYDGHTPASTILHPSFISLIRPGDLYLDVGCGYGRITRQLTALDVKTVALDPNFQELMQGKKESPEISFIQAYGEQLPFSSNIFDGTIALGVLGAVNRYQRGKILEEMTRSLKIGGLIYIAEFVFITDSSQRTHNGNQRWIDTYRKDSYVTGEYGSVVVHHRNDRNTYFITHHFRDDELYSLLQNAGIEVMASEKVAVRSSISGQLRDTLNIWGSLRATSRQIK